MQTRHGADTKRRYLNEYVCHQILRPNNFVYTPLVANDDGRRAKEVEGRVHLVTTHRDHESTNPFNRFDIPLHLCIRSGPTEHDSSS